MKGFPFGPVGFAVLLLAVAARGAIAPDSIGGKTYHEAHTIRTGPVTSQGESTIAFGADGRFVYVKNAPGFLLAIPQPDRIDLQAPRADGTYTYARTSETQAQVQLNASDGRTELLALQFASPTEGQADFPLSHQTFWLSDNDALAKAPAANASVRGRVSPGHPFILGFVVPGTRQPDAEQFPPPVGTAQREVLIRAVGPSLAPLGVSDPWSDPDFGLYLGNAPASVREAHYADWSAKSDVALALKKIFGVVGAFPLLDGSKDAVDVVRLAPGAYTVVCNPSPNDSGGEVLIEVYFLP